MDLLDQLKKSLAEAKDEKQAARLRKTIAAYEGPCMPDPKKASAFASAPVAPERDPERAAWLRALDAKMLGSAGPSTPHWIGDRFCVPTTTQRAAQRSGR